MFDIINPRLKSWVNKEKGTNLTSSLVYKIYNFNYPSLKVITKI